MKTIALLLVLLLAGCGGGFDSEEQAADPMVTVPCVPMPNPFQKSTPDPTCTVQIPQSQLPK